MASNSEHVQVYLRYARTDQDLVHAGTARLRDEVSNQIQFSLRKPVNIFLNTNPGIVGRRERERISEAQEGRCFLIPLLTPAYFESAQCIAEAETFLELESRSGRCDLVFPIYLLDADVLEDADQRADHAIAQALYEHRPADWRHVTWDNYDAEGIRQLALDFAMQVKAASELAISDAPPPNMPEQGRGVRFRINDDGLIDRAPDEAHDADENEARLRSLQSGLTEACDRLLGSSGHNTLGFVLDTIRAYREAIDRPLSNVQYTDVWRHGQRLQNLADAATREVDRLDPSLEDDQHAALNDLLDLHGPFMLSTEEGRALQAMADRYQATRSEQQRQKEAVQAFKEAIQDSTGLVTDAVKQVIAETSDELGKGRYPERASITAETTNRNFLSTAGRAAAYVGNHAAGGVIGGVAVGTALGSGLIGVSVEALNTAGQASTQFILNHQMVLKGLVACSADSLAWLNHLITWLRRRAPASTARPAPEDAPAIITNDFWTPGRVFRDIDEPWCPEMVVVPAGEFLMGSPEDEMGRGNDEGPLHFVTIKRCFALGRYPVTFEEFDHYCDEIYHKKPADSGWGRGRRPVTNVSWSEAWRYCDWLSEKTGRLYVLPSESWWEYACRAGSRKAYAFGETIDETQANFHLNVTGTTEVGAYPPNDFKLFDMHGNVREWCDDRYHSNYEGAPADGTSWHAGLDRRRVLRGGSWLLDARYMRSASRFGCAPGDSQASHHSFRCARVQEHES